MTKNRQGLRKEAPLTLPVVNDLLTTGLGLQELRRRRTRRGRQLVPKWEQVRQEGEWQPNNFELFRRRPNRFRTGKFVCLSLSITVYSHVYQCIKNLFIGSSSKTPSLRDGFLKSFLKWIFVQCKKLSSPQSMKPSQASAREGLFSH